MGTAIVVTSGKGGTGKSSFTVGVGACLAAMGKQVLCMDMDIGLRNLDLSLGMTDVALMDVTDVLQGRCPLSRAAARHPKLEGLSLLPAPMTLPKTPISQRTVNDLMDQVREMYDYCLIDCPAGIGSGFELAVCGADQAVVVANTDPITIRAAQAAVSRLRQRNIPAKLAMNRITRRFLRRMNTNVDDAMDALGLPLIGIIPEDPKITFAASRGVPVIMTEKRGAARAYYNIARRITGQQVPPMRI
jgi:septum site-determining protein MinD